MLETFGKIIGDNHFVAQAVADRNIDFLCFRAFLEFFAG